MLDKLSGMIEEIVVETVTAVVSYAIIAMIERHVDSTKDEDKK